MHHQVHVPRDMDEARKVAFQKLKTWEAQQMFDVVRRPGQKTVHADHFGTALDQALA
ncbi:hypothetical protein Ssi02_47320 [Sinosporangium siamense]|uniref:Uncharacterized protein n=1 Tax=Sinosporangium siamense TaxID=1367973 RepID=A0A919V8Q7_9ACTN|nr:hypothetical protein Ssi02_47320 [Sinosporangium siamense]